MVWLFVQNKSHKIIVLKGMGRAINKTVSLGEWNCGEAGDVDGDVEVMGEVIMVQRRS